MRYQEFQALDDTAQFLVMQNVLNRITNIPGFDHSYNSDFKNRFVGENKDQVEITMTGDSYGYANLNALALREYLDANDVKYEFDNVKLTVIVFGVEDLFKVFSIE